MSRTPAHWPVAPSPHGDDEPAELTAAPSADLSPLDVADHAFALLTRGPRPLAVDGRALGHGLPRRTINLAELKVILLHPSTDFQARDAVWRHLIGRARSEGPDWVVGAVGVAMPALRRAAARLAVGFPGETSDLDAELLAGFLTALRRVELGEPKVITRLCSPAFVAARKLRQARMAAARSGVVAGYSASPPPKPYGHPDLVLGAAIRTGVINVREADLIGATRLENVSVADYAASIGSTYDAVQRARKRAEHRLVKALRSGQFRQPGDDLRQVIIDATTTTQWADPE